MDASRPLVSARQAEFRPERRSPESQVLPSYTETRSTVARLAVLAAASSGNAVAVARGEHPQRTPFYGVCLLIAAFGMCVLASMAQPVWVSALIWIGAAAVAMVGFVMSFRDYD